MSQFEFGVDTFGDVTRAEDGRLLSQAEVLRNVVQEAVIAEQAGLDCFGVGEHHREDFAISAPEVMVGAIAARTSRLWLGSAVTVLSTDDPVRVFQRFSTLNAISNGRAEVILGRGSFTESYPLFGFDLAKYDLLFEEKLELFAAILDGDVVGDGRDFHVIPLARLFKDLFLGRCDFVNRPAVLAGHEDWVCALGMSVSFTAASSDLLYSTSL